jgi:hypothetical protein
LDLVRALDRILESLCALLRADIAEVVVSETPKVPHRVGIALQRPDP